MRRRTWISVWDALGYLVWGFGWMVAPPQAQGDGSAHPRRRDGAEHGL